MKEKTPLLLSLILMTSLPGNAHAGLGELGRAIGDVVSLGETGRQRDRERAKARENEARMRAEQARREKENRIKQLEEQRGIYTVFLGDFDYIAQNLTDISFSMNDMREASTRELSRRSWMRNVFVPRVRELWTDEETYSAELLRSIDQLIIVANREGARDSSVSPDVDIAQKKEILAKTRKVIVELRNIAKEQSMDVNGLLEVAMQRMNTDDAKLLVERLTGASQNVEALIAYVNERKTFNVQQITNINAQLQALKSN